MRAAELSFQRLSVIRSAARTIATVAVCGWCFAQPADPPSASPVRVSEQSLKAAYLYKFAGYVEWPDGAEQEEDGAPLAIGVLGSASLAQELAEITAGRTVNDRPIDVRRVAMDNGFDDLDVLFIGAQERSRLDEVLSAVQRLPVLTVTESEDALEQGSIINFTLDEQRVRFEVSLYAADLSGIRLSSRLLAVAQRVQRSPE